MVSVPATLAAILAYSGTHDGGINWEIWACIAPAQAAAAWVGAQLAQRIGGDQLSRIFAGALALTGAAMLRSSLGA